MMKLKFCFLIVVSVVFNLCYAQTNISIELVWSDKNAEIRLDSEIKYIIPNLESSSFDGVSFEHITHLPQNNSSQTELTILSYETSNTTKVDNDFIKQFNLEVPNELQFNFNIKQQRENRFGALSIQPYIREGNTIKRVTKVVFQRSTSNIIPMKTGHVFAANSVLAPGSGEWFKIRVVSDGVYRISYDFLRSMGIDVDNINPQHINIYGNGFGRLPELNSEFRPDDLIKNAIFIQGEADGSFDSGDFILFYAGGPHRWEDRGATGFSRVLNNYAEYSAYFININASEPPKRIAPASLSTANPTQVVTTFDNFAIHERENVNLIKGGQRWYGELFDAELTQNFTINIPNIVTGTSGRVRAFMACNIGGGGTNFEVRHNNQVIGSTGFAQAPAESWTRNGFISQPGQFTPNSSNINLQVRFNRNNPADMAYLDFLEVNARSHLTMSGLNQLIFRDKNSVGQGEVAQFNITNFPSNGTVWEITERGIPRLVNGQISAGTFQFTANTDSLRTFISFANTGFLTPTFERRVSHQNLHGLAYADYLIVTHRDFLNEAQRLAALHQTQGTSSHVVTLEQIYNEFSGGTQDPTAIRWFAKMFYDRANNDPNLMPKYLCLFGNGTYDPLDRIPNNTYFTPVYHTVNSESYIATIVSDDYFGFLDDHEEFSADDLLDIAVGRLIAMSGKHATDLVNKIEHYMKNGSQLFTGSGSQCGVDGNNTTLGDWTLRYTTIADDGDNGYFITEDLEPAFNFVEANHPEMNPNKIYSDAFQQITTAGGQRFPDVNIAINQAVEAGNIMMCYVGHGSPRGAAQERIITINQINEWRNIDRLMLFVSATCEFARIDDPEFTSAGEWMALNPTGAAIALMTTTRAVWFSTNSITTNRFFRNVFLRDTDEKPRPFGDIITDTKNSILGGSNNKRAFMLLGDPALRIALPYEKAVIDSLNGVAISSVQLDTIRALSKVRFSGHLEDQFGNSLNGFNGILQPSVFDKPQLQSTLGQAPDSPVVEFLQQRNVLYRGRVTVTNGRFNFEFIIPRDIDFSFGPGKASLYAFNQQNESAGGYSRDFIIGGIDTTGLDDNVGPEITLFLNDDSFVNGGITNETPILIAQLFDESGINTVGTGIGHDITAILNDETANAKVLNQFYEADLDTYQSGVVRYQMQPLEPGLHTLTFKAWDVNNNSSEAKIEFNVQASENVALRHVLNYPNPFTTYTEFLFEHNQVCASLDVKIEIFTVTGRLIRTIIQDVKTQGFRVEGIPWDGRDEFGDQLAKGVYVYRLTVRNPDGESAQEMQKLYLLK
jgi:hypothetical protein